MESFIFKSADVVLFAVCLFLLAGSIFISIKTRFVQVRLFGPLFKTLFQSLVGKKESDNQHVILPHRALFTAMSTTLGISTIVAPVIAIRLGGAGALVGFLLTSFFGSAATFIEVSLSVKHRKQSDEGKIMGGPMQYLKELLSPKAAKWYAICCMILMTAWSGAQANQVAAVLNSPLLGSWSMPAMISALLIVFFVMITLMGGIKRIGSFSSKLVPIMFILYVGSCLWIICSNLDKMGQVFHEIIVSLFVPTSIASGALVGGIVSALRWGVFKGIQTSEAGVGTQAIPHSMAETQDPASQGTLAMLSTYTAGFVAFLSGLVALITKTWQDPSLPLGVSMVAASFKIYFSTFGILIVAVSALLFGFGTILGNSYNGSQCYAYLSSHRKSRYYFAAVGFVIFLGAILDAKLVWSLVDFVLAAMAIPHMAALILHTRQPHHLLRVRGD